MIELVIAIYLYVIGLAISLSAKTRTRFLIGVELQILGIMLLATFNAILGILMLLVVAMEGIKMAAAISLR